MDLLWCFWITLRHYHLLADWRWCYPPLLKVQHADIVRLITTKELRPLINSVGVISSVLYFIIIKCVDETKLSFSAESVSATVTFPVKVTTVFLGSSATFGQKRCDTSAGCSEIFVSSCSGSEWQGDRRMDPDEVMYLYVITMIGPEPRCL